MNCMKCGRETKPGQVFCGECLKEMQNYPVNPQTAVYLPAHSGLSQTKKYSHHMPVSPEEQVRRLRKKVRSMAITIAVLAFVLAASVAVSVGTLEHAGVTDLLGQNYSTIAPQETAPVKSK